MNRNLLRHKLKHVMQFKLNMATFKRRELRGVIFNLSNHNFFATVFIACDD